MNLEAVDQLIGQLESGVQGRGNSLPANADIVEAFGFLGKHLADKDARYLALKQKLEAPVLRLDGELVGEFRALYRRLAERMQIDVQLERRILHVPNRIPAKERAANLLFAACLFVYAAIAIRADDFYLPAKRGNGIHLHGLPAWIMFAATLCAVVVLLSVIVDHYDTRDNERIYERLSKLFRDAGWTLFGLAFLAHFFLVFSK